MGKHLFEKNPNIPIQGWIIVFCYNLVNMQRRNSILEDKDLILVTDSCVRVSSRKGRLSFLLGCCMVQIWSLVNIYIFYSIKKPGRKKMHILVGENKQGCQSFKVMISESLKPPDLPQNTLCKEPLCNDKMVNDHSRSYVRLFVQEFILGRTQIKRT